MFKSSQTNPHNRPVRHYSTFNTHLVMELKDQVCTETQASELIELGVEPCSQFRWTPVKDSTGKYHVVETFEPVPNVHLPAFTVAELGLMLPWKYLNPSHMAEKLSDSEPAVGVWKTRKGFRFRVPNEDDCSEIMSEAQARAALLINLLEIGQTTAAEVNERLKTP